MKKLAVLFFINVASLAIVNAQSICISETEKDLYDLIESYREEKGLGSIQLSPKLIRTAQAHAKDLQDNYTLNDRCNPHSWSDNGPWRGCCYTNDHQDPNCMWEKPNEIAGYEERGYEIVYWHSKIATPVEALEGWKKSPAHNPVIINQDIWNQVEWNAVGIGISENYAVVWFGTLADAGFVLPCED